MALRSTQTGFGPVTKSFHWLMAILFATMFAIGWYMDLLPLGLEKLAWISILAVIRHMLLKYHF